MSQDNQRKLYDSLSQDYDMGSFEQFQTDIKNPSKRLKLYNATINEYDFGDFDSFSAQLGFTGESVAEAPRSERNTNASTNEEGTSGVNTLVSATKKEEEPYEDRYFGTSGDIERKYELPASGNAIDEEIVRAQAAHSPVLNDYTGSDTAPDWRTGKERRQEISDAMRASSSKGEEDSNAMITAMQNAGLTGAEKDIKEQEDYENERLFNEKMQRIEDAISRVDLPSLTSSIVDKDYAARNADRQNWLKEVYDRAMSQPGTSTRMGVAAGLFTGKEIEDNRTKKYGNIDALVEKAFTDIPKEKLEEITFQYLDKPREEATENELKEIEAFLKARIYADVHEAQVGKMTPKDRGEFFMRKVFELNPLLLPYQMATQQPSERWARLEAQERYGEDHPWLSALGMGFGMITDPTMYAGGAVAKPVVAGLTTATAKSMMKGMAKDMAVRGLASRLAGKTVGKVAFKAGQNALAGGVNFGVYEGAKEGERQLYLGGTVDPETGRLKEGEYDLATIGKQGLHGLGMGAAIGNIPMLFGNVGDKVVNWIDKEIAETATGRALASTAVRSGEFVTSKIAEGTVFSMPEWIEGERDAMDVWTDNLVMVTAMGLPHTVMGVGSRLNAMRKEAKSTNRSFAEILNKNMLELHNDRLAFTKDELEDLKRHGYGDLSDLFVKEKPKSFEVDDLGKEGREVKISRGEIQRGLVTGDSKITTSNFAEEKTRPEIDGFAEMDRLMHDSSVPESIKAKAYYILTGRILPMSTVTGWSLDMDPETHEYDFRTFGNNGQIITSTHFKKKSTEINRLKREAERQVELNAIDIGEKFAMAVADGKIFNEAVEAIAPGYDRDFVVNIYNRVKGGEEMPEFYQEIVDKIDSFYTSGYAKAHLPEGIRKGINAQFGIDIDKALKKDRYDRNEKENEAVEAYVKALYADKEFTRRQEIEEENQSAYESGRQAGRDLFEENNEPTEPNEPIDLREEPVERREETGNDSEETGMDALERAVEEMRSANEEFEDMFGDDAEIVRAIMEGDSGFAIAQISNLMRDREDQQEVALRYLNAYNTLKGLNRGIAETVDEKIEEERQRINQMSNQESHMIEPVLTKEGKVVYLVGGKLEMYPDGTEVDRQKSDSMLFVFNPETGRVEPTAPEFITRREEMIDPNIRLSEEEKKIKDKESAIKTEITERLKPSVTEGKENLGDNQEQVTERQEQGIESEETTKKEIAETESDLGKIPVDETTGKVIWDGVEPDVTEAALLEKYKGNEGKATGFAQMQLEASKKAVKEAEKIKLPVTDDADEYERAYDEREKAIEEAKKRQAHWERVLALPIERKAEAENEELRIKREAEIEAERIRNEELRIKKEAEAKEKAEREEAERIEREKLNGVPDWSQDTPQDARARGYRRDGAGMVERQEPLEAVIGKEVNVKFSDKEIPSGKVAVIEAENLQPSHIQGQMNPGFFIDEAQPKKRTDAASVDASRKIASNIRPEEITSSVTAYTGAPTVNRRGEVIQGNNRSDALRLMWESYKEQGEKYRQYLIDHAEELGLDAEAIRNMKNPVLVNMLDVADEEAIRLGQYGQTDIESGGVERIKPKQTVQKMGKATKNFANILLRTSDEESSFSSLVDQNGVEALKWLSDRGYITPTQYKSAFDSKGNLTGEAANDLKGILYQTIFTGGSTQLEEMFNTMPAKAQRAILATAFRDHESANNGKILPEIQQSIIAFNMLMGYQPFADAKNINDARRAAEEWKRSYAFDEVSGESILPSDNFSNFAIELATHFKGQTQSYLQGLLNEMFDVIQGAKEDTLFEEADKTPKTLAEAIKIVLGMEYQPINRNKDGQNGSDNVDISSENGKERQPRSIGGLEGRERDQEGTEPADSGRGTETDSRERLSEKIAEAEAEVNTEPTDKQKEAGNYKMGHVRIGKFDVTIENPKGSVRSGVDADGKAWSVTMQHTYGYIKGTKGVDGDHIDVFLKNTADESAVPETNTENPTGWNGEKVFVVDQYNPDGSFDEHKVMLGFNDKEEAYNAYLSNYEKDWEKGRRIDITEVSTPEFEKWIDSSKRKTKPFAEYTTVKKEDVVNQFQYFTDTLNSLISIAKEKSQGLIKKIISPVSSRLQADLLIRGIAVDDTYKHVIDNYAINHALKKHGGETERKRGQIPLEDKDFENVEEIVTNYDSIRIDRNGGKEIIKYQKTYPDGTTYYIEEVRSGRKELAMVTMYKHKNTNRTDENLNKPTSHTPKATSDLIGVSESKGSENSGDKKEGKEFRGKVKDKLEAIVSIEKERETALDEIWGTEKDTDEARKEIREKYDALNQERRRELLKSLQNASNDELAELVKDTDLMGRIGRALPKYEGVKEFDAIQDRLSWIGLNEAAKALYGKAAELPMTTNGLKKPKFDLYNYISNDKQRPNLQGVYHDGETGMAVSTDTGILIALKEGYNPDKAGKIIDKKGNEIEKIFVDGKEVEAKFPNWMRIMPKGTPTTTAVLTMPKVMHLAQSLRDAMKGMSSKDKEIASVALRMPDGTVGIYNMERLAKLFEGMHTLGSGVLEYFTTGPILAVRDGKGSLLLMGYNPQSLEKADLRIDLGKKSSPEEKPKTIFEEAERITKEGGRTPGDRLSTRDLEKEEQKIEDFGEKISGARKDALKDLARNIENVTIQSLIEQPLSKAFKKPDIKKLYESGAISDEDALLAEAVMQGLVLANKKPVLTKKSSSKKEIEKWAQDTYRGIKLLGEILSGDPGRREKALLENKEKLQQQAEKVNDYIKKLREWNPDKEFKDVESMPDPLEVTRRVLEGIGYRPGDKVELPLSQIVYDGRHYKVDNAGKQSIWFKRYHDNLDEAIETMILAAKLKRGDMDVELPQDLYGLKGTGQRHYEPTGKYAVQYWGKGKFNIKEKIFDNEAEAKDFAEKNNGHVIPQQKATNIFDKYAVTVTNPLTGERHELKEFNDRMGALGWIDENREEVNTAALEAINKEMGVKGNERSHFYVASNYVGGDRRFVYSVMEEDKNNPWPFIKDFNTRKEAEQWLEENKERLEKERKERKDAERKIVYFSTEGRDRKGPDYREGKDSTPEMYDENFGFRGVQFGNWANQRDRREAMDQAFDSFKDLARLTGLPERAMSLDGELGLAFGARGSGSALAHYEPTEVVINLTKTRGAGSLGHEWWHALDNYLSRRAGVPMGFLTHRNGINNANPDVVAAFESLMNAVKGSSYGRRSQEKGAYWGQETEMTARLFAEWISEKLRENGEDNGFLARGVDANAMKLYQQMNYNRYINNEIRKAKLTGKEAEIISREEFNKRPESLRGFPYPTTEEVKAFSPYIERVLDALGERERETGSMAEEPRRGYGKNVARTSEKSLFDWADEETSRKENIGDESLDPEMERAGEEANRAIDEYSGNFANYLKRTEEIEAELKKEDIGEEERLALEQERDVIEEVILDEKERVADSLREFYAKNNTPDDAELLSREMVARVQAEVSVRLNGKRLLDDLLTPVKEIKLSGEPISEIKESKGEIKTAGGPISYTAKGHLPDAEKGEFSYVERQFLRSNSFSFTGREKIRDRGDVAYIFKELENYSIENVFAVMQRGDGSYKIVHIGMGTPTSSPADLGAIRGAFDAFGAEKIWFVHNHPSGVLSPSPADQQLMRMIEDAFTYLGVETEGIIMDTRSGKYSSFHGTGRSEKFDRAREMEESEVDVYSFDRMDRSKEPVEKERLNMPHLVVDYISKLREGKEPRVSYLLLNNQLEVLGNFHTDYKEMGDPALAEEMASVGIKFGAKAIIPYGNVELKGVKDLDLEVRQYSMGDLKIVDALQVREEGHRSAYDAGMMEPDVNYGKESLDEINRKFNEELEKFDKGELKQGHRFELGMPSENLKAAGFPDLPITMRAGLLESKSKMGRHPFEASDLINLVKAIQSPIAIFHYSKDNMRNLIVDITRGDKHFLVGVTLNYKAGDIEVNSVSGLFPKDNLEWLKWIQDGKAISIGQKEKVLDLIDSLRTTNTAASPEENLNLDNVSKESEAENSVGTNPAQAIGLDLDATANIIRNFENPKYEENENEVRDSGSSYGRIDFKEAVRSLTEDLKISNKENLEDKKAAIRKIGGNLNKLRSAMARQREYDESTVKSVTDLARALIDGGLLDELSKGEMKLLLQAAKDAVGKTDISRQVNKVLDIMIKNQLRNVEKELLGIIQKRGSRVDDRSIIRGTTLDPEGERYRKMYREAISKNPEEINRRLREVEEELADPSQVISERANTEYEALHAALAYLEGVKGNKEAEKELRKAIRDAEEQKKAGRMTADAFKQYKEAVENDIMDLKLARIKALEDVAEMISEEFENSRMRMQAWKEAEKERVKEIQHLVNADLQGREPRGDDKLDKVVDKFLNGPIGRAIFAPLATFDQMLKMLGSHSPDGMGNLYNHFMRKFIDSSDKEQELKEKYLRMADDIAGNVFKGWTRSDEKRKSPFTMMKAYDYAQAGNTLTVTYFDGVKERTINLSQPNMLYLYSVDKMPNGRATNRRMGLTEEVMEKITEAIDPKLKRLADRVQDELMREIGLNADEVYQRMFGAHMDIVENYFPSVRDKDALKTEKEIGEVGRKEDRITTITNSVKRKNGSTAKWKRLEDLDWFEILFDHISEQTHWQSHAELNRDLTTLVNYSPLRQKLLNMRSVYGSGKELLENFEKVCAIATDCYDAKAGKADQAYVGIAKGVTASKISGRIFTALKQTLSLPAFLGEVSVDDLIQNLETGGIFALQWAWENMPNFRKRVLSRTSGNYLLNETAFEKELSHATSRFKKSLNWIKKLSDYGMLANVGVDAWTVAIGSEAVYKKAKRKYLRWGMDEARAERMALQDAEICFNKSQQSSEGAFMAPIQKDRTFWSVTAMQFRNSSTSYTREAHTSLRNLRNLMTGKVTEESVAKQILRKMDIKPYNEQFNEDLKRQISGTLPQGHIYQLGKPGKILLSAGFPDMQIEMSSTRLAEKASQANHPFTLQSVKGLVDALNRPIAVFDYGNNAKNVIVSLQYQGKQFLVGVHFNQNRGGIEVSSIRGLFPKDSAEWLNWIIQGKAAYLDHKRIQALIDQQRINLADVDYLDLNAVANIMESFENPDVPEIKNDPRWSEEEWTKAKKFAKKEIRKGYVKNMTNLAMFGWILPFLWRLGGALPGLMLGGAGLIALTKGGKKKDEDKDKDKENPWKRELKNAALASVFGPTEGIMFGDVASDAMGALTGLTDKEWNDIGRSNPMLQDIVNILKEMDYDSARAYSDMFNILVSMGIGVNPQTVTDIVCAIKDYLGDDAKGQAETALLIARILNCPPSQLDKVYFDEVGLDGTEAAKLTPAEIAERYATYKRSREAWLGDLITGGEHEEKSKEKKRKKVLKVAKDKLEGRLATEETKKLMEEYDEYNKDKRNLNSIDKTENPEAYWDEWEVFQKKWGPYGEWKHKRIRAYKRDIKEMKDSILSKGIKVEEMQELVERMIRTRDVMLKELNE